MSMLSCPLCGKQNSLRYFNPEALSQNDIQAIELRGLGRGKAWEIVGRPSVLDDKELTSRIAARCRTILKIIGEEVTDKAEAVALQKRIGDWRKEALWRRTKIMELQESVEELEDKVVELQGSVDAYEEESDGILAQVNKALSKVYEEFSDLEEGVLALITEYNEAMEEDEDEEGAVLVEV